MTKTRTKIKFKRSFKTSAIIVVACLLAFSCFSLIYVNKISQINKQQQKLESIEQQCVELEAKNAELQEVLDSGDEDAYIERVARENGYVKPNERVYVDISADE